MRTDLEGYRFRVKIRLRLRMGAFGPKGYRYWVSFSCQNFAWAKLSRLGGAVWGHRRPSWGHLGKHYLLIVKNPTYIINNVNEGIVLGKPLSFFHAK